MRVNVGNRTLELRFGYQTVKESKLTTCVVTQVLGHGTEILVGRSSVKKHPKQNHCRFVARRHALTRALSKVERSERTVIWKAYLSVVRVPK